MMVTRGCHVLCVIQKFREIVDGPFASWNIVFTIFNAKMSYFEEVDFLKAIFKVYLEKVMKRKNLQA